MELKSEKLKEEKLYTHLSETEIESRSEKLKEKKCIYIISGTEMEST